MSNSLTPHLSPDDLLCLEHERYIQMVTDSGIPLWVLDLYHLESLMYEEVERNTREP
jgi:hypothetical protein